MSLFEKRENKDIYMVRTENAGVFCGEISEINEETRRCDLKNARRMWYWEGAASLSELAAEGTSKPSECKFPCEVKEISVFEVIEIIKMSSKAIKSIQSVPVWSAKDE